MKPIRVYHVAQVCGMEPRELRDFLHSIFGDYPTSSVRVDPTMAIALVATFNPEPLRELEAAKNERG